MWIGTSIDRIIGYIVRTDESLREKKVSEVRKGFPWARAAHVPHRRVACESHVPESVPRRVLEKAQLVLKYATLQKLTLDEL